MIIPLIHWAHSMFCFLKERTTNSSHHFLKKTLEVICLNGAQNQVNGAKCIIFQGAKREQNSMNLAGGGVFKFSYN